MHLFFQCVAEAVAQKGLRALAELVPGGGVIFDIARLTWEKYRVRRHLAQIHEDVEKMAEASFDEAKEAAVAAAKEAAGENVELVPVLVEYLTQIPATVRQSLKRADDPTGRTTPPGYTIRNEDDVARLLPASLPRFHPGDPLPGKAGWVLERPIGAGGFGEVWLARHPQFHSLTGAVKFCRHLETRDRDVLHEGKLIDRLLAEAPHPNIVRLIDVHLEGDAPWLMYEYVEAGDLGDLIHQWAGLPPTERQANAIAALVELASAIAHFHRLDPAIVHRDLKPANILRDRLGRLRITDFGIGGIAAQHMIENESRGTTTRAVRLQSYLYGSYTPLYASPQQRDGDAPDPRDDVHALGVIGYQILTGQMARGVGPDFADDLKEASVAPDFIELLRRCTAQKIERRPRDAGEVAAGLSKLESSLRECGPTLAAIPVVLPVADEPPPAATPRRHREVGWARVIRAMLKDPIEKTAFINQTRAFLEVLKTTEKNIQSTRVLSIIFPAVFGGGSVLMIALPLSFFGALPVWFSIPAGLGVGVIVSALLLLLLMIIRNTQQAKQDAAIQSYTAAHPILTETCGGAERLRNSELIRSILDSVDDLPKPGFFGRLFGG